MIDKCKCKTCELVKITIDKKDRRRISCKYSKNKEFLNWFCDEPLVEGCLHYKRIIKDLSYYNKLKTSKNKGE